jgi:hypothetical protein
VLVLPGYASGRVDATTVGAYALLSMLLVVTELAMIFLVQE